jgi:thymidylate kinase
MKKKLIICEGPDNIGKTTQVQRLLTHYDAKQIVQPSGTNIVGYLRDVVKNNMNIGPGERQLLHTISHIADMISYFDGKKNLVMDRCHISALVYGKITGVSDELNQLIQDIHRSFYQVFIKDYDVHVVFLTRRERYEVAPSDNFEATINWNDLKRAYESMYDIHCKLPRIFTFEDSSEHESVHRVDVADYPAQQITEMIIHQIGE